jgi:NADH dehydrogenase FAD-containing subunit
MREQNETEKILILGGGYAGMLAAARIARSGAAAEVTLIDAKPGFVQRIRLHEILAGRSPETLDYAPLLAKRGVRFVQARVESLEPGAQRVTARDASGAPIALGYDALVLALGSTTAAGVPGVAETLGTTVRLDHPAELRKVGERLADSRGLRVLVAGAGLTGLEAATELAERFPGHAVTLATRGHLGDGFSPAAAAHLRRRLTALGVALREESEITAVVPGRALLAGGEPLPFDLCVWCGGFAAPPLAREAGFAVDAWGRVRVDAALRVLGHPEIFAAGDAAAVPGAGSPAIRMGCVSALPSGAHAGENVVRWLRGEEPAPFDMAFAIRCISLGRRDGLVQHVTGDDRPLPRVWTGRWGAFVKEMICRMTLFVVKRELSTGLRLYHWPRRPAELIQSDRRASGPAPHLPG